MTYGMKVSQVGKDVKTADTKDLVFSSPFANFKIVKEELVETSVPSGSGITTKTVAHSLGYTPGFICYHQLATTTVSYFNSCIDIVQGPPNMTNANAYTNASNIVFEYQQSTTAGAYTAKTYYYLLADIGA